MSAGLILVLAVAVAYLAAHVAFDWLAKRLLLVSGAEYLILGILLGPYVSGVLSVDTLSGFAPLTTLALGWIGAIVGTQFYLPGLVRISGVMYRLAFGEALGTLAFVGGLLLLLFVYVFGLTWQVAIVPAIALGAIAAVSAPTGIAVVARRLVQRGTVVRQLQVATAIDALVGIATLGLLLSIFHPGDLASGYRITPTEWVVITLGIGVTGGALFHLFLGGDDTVDRLFISLGGALIMISGAASYLHLSPLLAALIFGATLTNTSRHRELIARTLSKGERPFYFVLLIFAGAAWTPSLRMWVIPVVVFLVARILGKVWSARIGSWVTGQSSALGRDWGLALIGQGGLALALALDYLSLEGAQLGNIVFTAAIASVLLTDLMSARIVQSVLAPLLGGQRISSERPAVTEPATSEER
jgi:Kef-type K+ transport system membrane component KefB